MQVNNEFTKLSASNLNFFYGSKQVLKNISLSFNKKEITALIGPSGCGKSTFLRTLNRMNDLIEGARLEGSIKFGNEEINHQHCDVVELRRRIGMVFQRPTPFAKSIFENVVYGLKVSGVTNKSLLMEKAEESLRRAALWDEVKDRLKDSALSLSGGQQQRLCIEYCLWMNRPAHWILLRQKNLNKAWKNLRRICASSLLLITCSRRCAFQTIRPSFTWASWSNTVRPKRSSRMPQKKKLGST